MNVFTTILVNNTEIVLLPVGLQLENSWVCVFVSIHVYLVDNHLI